MPETNNNQLIGEWCGTQFEVNLREAEKQKPTAEELSEYLHSLAKDGVFDAVCPFQSSAYERDYIDDIIDACTVAVGAAQRVKLLLYDAFRRISENIRQSLAPAWDDFCESIYEMDSFLDWSIAEENATPKEIHYMFYSKKHRIRNKYKNRVLRRVRKDQKKERQQEGEQEK